MDRFEYTLDNGEKISITLAEDGYTVSLQLDGREMMGTFSTFDFLLQKAISPWAFSNFITQEEFLQFCEKLAEYGNRKCGEVANTIINAL